MLFRPPKESVQLSRIQSLMEFSCEARTSVFSETQSYRHLQHQREIPGILGMYVLLDTRHIWTPMHACPILITVPTSTYLKNVKRNLLWRNQK